MSLLENLEWRYATKKYDATKKVAQEDVDKILEAARLAPTSSGLQQYRVLVITNQELKDKIVPIAWDQQIVAECSHLLVFAAWDRYTQERIDQVVNYLHQDKNINEVILSGGDPLATSDQRLNLLLEKIASVPHIKRLRIHTRLPVVIPQRITDKLLESLSQSRLKIVWVLHINHAQEIDLDLQQACQRIKQAGMLLLNQSVLLKGINASIESLVDLSEALFNTDIQPYYLHVFDPVAGAAHFNIPDKEAVLLWKKLQAELPGFLLPKLVREIPGESSKSLL